MLENDRVLDHQTVEAIVDNLRSMTPSRRTEMIAQILPFLGAFLAELLRAINLSQLPADEGPETIEDDDAVLLQLTNHLDQDVVADDTEDDVNALTQKFNPVVPFGSKLCQLQGHLNSFDKTQCAQVACHLRMMTGRLRSLAGEMSPLVADRFLRLEALVATYFTEEVDVPLSLQVWTGQLKTLVPYLNGGRTPECPEGVTAGSSDPNAASSSVALAGQRRRPSTSRTLKTWSRMEWSSTESEGWTVVPGNRPENKKLLNFEPMTKPSERRRRLKKGWTGRPFNSRKPPLRSVGRLGSDLGDEWDQPSAEPEESADYHLCRCRVWE